MVLVEILVLLAFAAAIIVIGTRIVAGYNQRQRLRLDQRGEAVKLALQTLASDDLRRVKRVLRVARNNLPPELVSALEEHESDLIIETDCSSNRV